MLDGGCDCGGVRYRVETAPLIVHCCHCRWCQRETGSAFALNAVIETDRVTVLRGEPELVTTPSASGKRQLIARCPTCRIAVWSHYAGNGPFLRFVRVGTLDTPDALPPDVHIFTASKQPWVSLPRARECIPNTTGARRSGRRRPRRATRRCCRPSQPGRPANRKGPWTPRAFCV